MSRFDKLFRLAQKTGDTLIVHHPDGRDMVIMDVDRYEDMVDENSWHDIDSTSSLCDMDEREMLDKINRDIAVWRSHQEEEDCYHKHHVLDSELAHEPPFDPFEEDMSHTDAWHRAGDVLQNRRNKYRHTRDDILAMSDTYDFGDEDEEDLDDVNFFANNDENGVEVSDEFFSDVVNMSDDDSEEDMEKTYHPLNSFEEKKDIPFASHAGIDFDDDEDDELLDDDDEPIFFEEPV